LKREHLVIIKVGLEKWKSGMKKTLHPPRRVDPVSISIISPLNKKCSSQGEGGTLTGTTIFSHKTQTLARGKFIKKTSNAPLEDENRFRF